MNSKRGVLNAFFGLMILMRSGAFPASIAPVRGTNSLVVTNNSDAVNGDTSSPDALIANPGADGVSLREAMLAAQGATESLAISFDPSLKGAVISLGDGLPPVRKGRLSLNGDFNHDGRPDVTLDGGPGKVRDCLLVLASDVRIAGLTIRNIEWTGITICAGTEGEATRVERVALLENTVSAGWSAIHIATWGSNRIIKNIDILRNRLINNGSSGIAIDAAPGSETNSANEIANVTLRGNLISNNGDKIAVFATASRSNAINNIISDLEISENTIRGHKNTTLLVTAANESYSQGNRVESLEIRNNDLRGRSCAIEILGSVGEESKDNHVSGVVIEGNLIKDEESILVAGDSDGGSDNSVEDLLINRNTILGGLYQGIHIESGGADAKDGSIRNVRVTNNLIARKGGAGILLSGWGEDAAVNIVKDVTILNNTVVYTGDKADWASGIRVDNSSNKPVAVVSGVKIANTVLWINNQKDSISGNQTPASVRNCILADPRYRGKNGSFYAAPQFISQAKNNYQLLATSPAIDKGATSGADAGDFDLAGYPRVVDGDGDGTAVADIGAYERQRMGVRFCKLTIAADTHGRTDPGTGVYYLPMGTQITLKALPKEGCAFRKWSGGVSSVQNPLTITLNGSKTITANFKIIASAN